MVFRFVLIGVVALFCTVARAAKQDVTFSFDAKQLTDRPATVHVAGTFNGWNTSGLALTDNQGLWSGSIKLEEGEYQYKFVLDAGTPKQKWLQDPNADPALNADDGNGGQNSGMVVGPGSKKLPPPQPHHINDDGVVFNGTDLTDLNVVDSQSVRVRVRVQQGDVERALAVTDGRAGWDSQDLKPLTTIRGLTEYGGLVRLREGAARNVAFRLVDGEVSLNVDAKAGLDFSEGGFEFYRLPAASDVPQTPAWARDAVWYQIFAERFRNGDPSNDPGDLGSDRLVPWNGNWWESQPGEAPGAENFYKGKGNVWNRRYGGDLQGVTEKLPYLRELGINAIYFCPMFEAESMHKYDAADFRHIDDNFGAKDPLPIARPVDPETGKPRYAAPKNKLYTLDGKPVADDHVETDDPATWRWTKSDLVFLQFLKDAHEQGFHVILDGVFNHVGRAHPFFQDVLARGKNSPYADWFEITDWGDESNWKPMADPYKVHGKPGGIRWKAWDKDDGHLPVFKKNPKTGLAKGPYDHIMGITKRWGDPDGNPATRDGIDGWRLDVPGDIPHPFWRDWRKVVKAANPDAYITGEIWSPAQPWVNAGDQFDAVMNYQFAMACQDFFADVRTAITPTQFNDKLVKLEYMYPFQSALVMQNLFDSHDTDRAVSWFVNPDRPYDGQNRPQDNAASNPYSERAPNADEWKRYQQMVAFQMTFVGAPMVYYGNEAGMWSPDDPSNRQPYPWPDKGPYAQPGVGFNASVFDHYQRFVAIRSALPALRDGFYYPVKIDDASGLIVFAREGTGEPASAGGTTTAATTSTPQTVYVALNRSSAAQEVTLDLPDGTYVDYADAQQVEVKMSMLAIATARPVTRVLENAGTSATGGKLTLKLEPFGTAVLVKR